MIKLELTPEEMKIVSLGLEELKFKVAYPILAKLKRVHDEYIKTQQEIKE